MNNKDPFVIYTASDKKEVIYSTHDAEMCAYIVDMMRSADFKVDSCKLSDIGAEDRDMLARTLGCRLEELETRLEAESLDK